LHHASPCPAPRILPTTPTLFPYTTLFRSHASVRDRGGLRDPKERVPRAPGALDLHLVSAVAQERHPGPLHAVSVDLLNLHLSRKDRKSTRLNSSHVKIQYAVVCLKKKDPK